MKFYALVLWRTRGVVPAMLQLVYLGSGELVRYVPDEQDLLATERKVEAIWRAIALATETGDWRPRRSRLCDWCAHQAICPEWGGTPPPLPRGRAGRSRRAHRRRRRLTPSRQAGSEPVALAPRGRPGCGRRRRSGRTPTSGGP